MEFLGAIGAPVIFRPHDALNSVIDRSVDRPLLPQPVYLLQPPLIPSVFNQNVPSFYPTAMYNNY
jgi:hypothetical protein